MPNVGATFRRRIVGALIVSFLGLFAPAIPRASAAPPASEEQILRWVAELDSEQFMSRELATQRLIEAGRPAIAPIVAQATNGSLESASRAVHVLRELALSTDESLEESARQGLNTIANSANPSAARRAEKTLASLNDVRQRRAIDELQRLGAKFNDGLTQVVAPLGERGPGIEIGPDWRGQERDLQRLKWLHEYRYVAFTGDRANDNWMKYLIGMPHLGQLTLKRTSVTDQGLSIIRELPKLQVVSLMYTPFGDQATEHLRTMKQATNIRLFGTNITKDAARDLKEALGGAKIDYRRGGFLGVNCQAHPLGCEIVLVQPNSAAMDAGLESSDVILKYGQRRVESFETLTSHISENSPGDQVILEVVRNVRLRRNGIDKTETSKLGITAQSNTLGVEILTVEPDSFVARLELKPGDVITACDETRVLDLATLEAAFQAAKVAEKLNLDYVRSATLVSKAVKLGAWE